MDKELTLALAFNAPDELKELATKHQENFLRLEKANAQCELWGKQKEQAEKDYDQSAKQLRKAASVWVEENVKPKIIEDAPIGKVR